MTENNNAKILVRPFAKLDPDNKKEIERPHEEKQYILLLYMHSNCNDGSERTFEVITGRSFVREFLIERLDEIDIESSYVLLEDISFKDTFANQVTVYRFLKLVQKYYDDGFDIDDYHSSLTAEDLNDNNINEDYDPVNNFSNVVNTEGQVDI